MLSSEKVVFQVLIQRDTTTQKVMPNPVSQGHLKSVQSYVQTLDIDNILTVNLGHNYFISAYEKFGSFLCVAAARASVIVRRTCKPLWILV